MKKYSRPILVTALVLSIMFLVIAQFSGTANSAPVQIISASPGQTVMYQGTGNPNSQANMEVSATVSVGVNNNNHYVSYMNGVNIPGGSRFSISASPVDSLTVSGSFPGIPLGSSIQGSVTNHVGSASMSNIPGSTYDITISGVANGSRSVSLTVHAYQTLSIGGDGTFTASISTSGLPSAVYSVKQNGQEVAKIYLGVPAPATPTPAVTPTATPSPSPNSTITPTPTVTPGSNFTPTPTQDISPTPRPGSDGSSFLGLQLPSFNLFGQPAASPSAQPAGIGNASGTAGPAGGHNSLLTTILVLIGAVIAGLVIGYVVVFVILKK